jgi:hypothetical protein
VAVKLNRKAFDKAKRLVSSGRVVRDDREEWSQHQAPAKKENEFIRQNGYEEYGRWHLGLDDGEDEHTKARYKFPYGDFKDVHRCGVISAESRAGQYKYADIENAAADLHELIDKLKHEDSQNQT